MATSSVETRSLREILTSYWNHIDVLLLALAYLPEGVNRLTADAGKWGQVVMEAKEELRTIAPELLARVHFDYRDPSQPCSRQLDEFFHVVGLSGKLEWSPSDNSFYISEETKGGVRATRGSKLGKYEDAIRQLSSKFQILAIPYYRLQVNVMSKCPN